MIGKRTVIIMGFGLVLMCTGAILARSTNLAKTPTNPTVKATQLSIPAGYQPILNTPGIQVFKNSTLPNYVTTIDLNRAEAIDLTGKYTDAPQAKVVHRSMSEFWQDAVSQNSPQKNVRVIINGAFFAGYKEPTAIAFGLKSAGKVISYGYGLDEFPGLNKTIAWNNTTKQAKIADYDQSTFDRPEFPEVVGALAQTAGKRANRQLARTFIGVKDNDGDGKNETILVFSSQAAKQIEAVNTLNSFGAQQVAMLDGGGSTGLIIDGKKMIDSGTSVPHAIGFYTQSK
jgi:hypothetical protein